MRIISIKTGLGYFGDSVISYAAMLALQSRKQNFGINCSVFLAYLYSVKAELNRLIRLAFFPMYATIPVLFVTVYIIIHFIELSYILLVIHCHKTPFRR